MPRAGSLPNGAVNACMACPYGCTCQSAPRTDRPIRGRRRSSCRSVRPTRPMAASAHRGSCRPLAGCAPCLAKSSTHRPPKHNPMAAMTSIALNSLCRSISRFTKRSAIETAPASIPLTSRPKMRRHEALAEHTAVRVDVETPPTTVPSTIASTSRCRGRRRSANRRSWRTRHWPARPRRRKPLPGS
jgi:hypothetical protein